MMQNDTDIENGVDFIGDQISSTFFNENIHFKIARLFISYVITYISHIVAQYLISLSFERKVNKTPKRK